MNLGDLMSDDVKGKLQIREQRLGRKVQRTTEPADDQHVYAGLIDATNQDSLWAAEDFLGNFDPELEPIVRVPRTLATDYGDRFRLSTDALEEFGWRPARAVVSKNMNVGSPFGEKLSDTPRYIVWGPEVNGDIIELNPGVYDIQLPETEANISAQGVSVKEYNKGKNAYEVEIAQSVRRNLRRSGVEPSNANVIDEVARMDGAEGMKLFFRSFRDAPPVLYAMRESPEGVEEFVDLHADAVFRPGTVGSPTLLVPQDDIGYWVGKGGDFIQGLASAYGAAKIFVDTLGKHQND